MRHLDISFMRHHDDSMRTTLTLEPDVARRLEQEIRRTGRGMKAVVNEALRSGLGLAARREKPRRFVVRPHSFGFKPGVDLNRLNQLVDELEAEEVARRLGK
jgi:Ribbon-helix-helix protein, copG family